VILTSLNAPSARAQVNYVLHEIPLVNPLQNDAVNHNGMNHVGMVVGSHYPGGIKTGFVYDHFGLIGDIRTTHSITEWMDVPSPWAASSCVGINDVGEIVGLLESANGQRVGFLLDLDVFSLPRLPTLRILPSPPVASSSFGRRINNNGLVLIESQAPVYSQYLLDSRNPTAQLVQIIAQDGVLPISSVRYQDINDLGQLSGAGNAKGYWLTPPVALVNVPGANYARLNNSGQLGLNLFAVRDSRGRIIKPDTAARWSTNGLQPLSDFESTVRDINDSGDVCGYNIGKGNPAIYQEGFGWLYLDNVVKGSIDDLTLWFHANTNISLWYISNRNATGFGNLFATAIRTTTTGKGKSAVTTTVIKHYFVEPTLTTP